ncbi:helix-turn-helix transcriptional regulator [Streptomyces sp. DSM 41524]|uniref:Helix-turn-helix transcriptional regulator n=1 Tax=Streptomyces asiaticus subsp. ignotus TaxID=3098222 RepID=A0ABU7PPZ3_9ACTN|nr:helix-turn-helix transcriptional regulator [Streptomyces sp. DSM 41524]
MDHRAEAREFLTSRRAKITPEQAGLPTGSRRRVPGLRRSEVAALADMSVEYYAKLERGSLAGASPAVLEAVARALQLDDAERAHLLHLAQAADGSDALTRPRRRTARQWTLHRSLQWTLDAITAGPAIVSNGRMDILAAEPGLSMTIYTAEPGSSSEEGLRLLASWAATGGVSPQAEHPTG